MNLRLEIATKIYCSYIKSGHTPDIELTFNTADEILAYAKEPKGFFVSINQYQKAIDALRILLSEKSDKPNEFITDVLKDLGEM